MPCWTVEIASVKMPAMRADLLCKALLRLGAKDILHISSAGVTSFALAGHSYRLQGGVLSYEEGAPNIADAIKVAYSRQVIAKVAKANQWTVQEVAANAFEVAK